MRKLSALVAGLGLGAAQGYMQKKSNESRDARVAALFGKDAPVVKPSLLEQGVDKVKSLFASEKPDAGAPTAVTAPDNRPAFNVPLEQQAAQVAPPPSSAPVADADASTAPPVAEPAPAEPIADAAPAIDASQDYSASFADDSTIPNEPVPFKNCYA